MYIFMYVYLFAQAIVSSTWKKDHEILVALQYRPLYNISRSEKWGKKNKPQLIMAHVR